MPQSANLKLFKATWAKNCQSMWSELLCIAMAESYIITNYSIIQKETLLTGLFYSPGLESRLGDLRKDSFMERAEQFRDTIVTNRIVFLSAAFETYFRNFLDDYMKSKPSLYDHKNNSRTATGDKLYGDILKTRGMVEKIEEYAVLSGRSTKAIQRHFSYLRDLYILRNVMAHEAGRISASLCSALTHVKATPDEPIRLSSDDIVEFAKHAILIAEGLDVKLTAKKS